MTDVTNPWLSPQATTGTVTQLATGPAVPAPTGPTSPQQGIPIPDQVDRLPTFERQQSAELWWLGVHGGAGESTLAAINPHWPAADHGWPRTADGFQARVMLVARSDMRGLRAAQAAATQWASGLVPHAEVVGLVLLADAPGRMPKVLREAAQVISGGVPRTWTIPWIDSWRLDPDRGSSDPSREIRRMFDELATILRNP